MVLNRVEFVNQKLCWSLYGLEIQQRYDVIAKVSEICN